MKISKIIELVKGEIIDGDDFEIYHLAKIEDAGPGDITFLSNPKYIKYLSTTNAGAVLVAKNLQSQELEKRTSPICLIRVDDPYVAFLKLLDVFYPAPDMLQIGIHPSAVIAESAKIENDAAIGANVFIGEKCIIGKNSSIWHGTVLQNDVVIGNDTVIYPNVSIRENCKIGNRVIIHSGTVIGSDGFGFAPKPDGTYEKIPQRGIVVIEDDVEIGSNCSIDRATLGETRIKKGVKLDNLIQVAHNVVIEENTVIAAQTGISGSTKIGKNCILGGQVGVVGHIKIADRTIVAAQSGVSKPVKEEGKTVFGYPALEAGEMRRIIASQRSVPELIKEFDNLKKRLIELEKKFSDKNKKVIADDSSSENNQ